MALDDETTQARHFDLLSVTCLSDQDIALLLEAHGHTEAEAPRNERLQLLESGLADGLHESWCFERFPENVNTQPRCWASIAFHRKFTSHDIYMFGGRDMSTFGDDECDEVFTWVCGDSRGQWVEVPNQGDQIPDASWAHSAVEHEGCLFVFGGQDYEGRNDYLFKLDLGVPATQRLWEQVGTTGNQPEPRSGHAAIITPHGDMLVFGGVDNSDTDLNDLHAYKLSTQMWRPLKTKGTPPQGGDDVRLALRPSTNELYVLDGIDKTDTLLENIKMYALNLGTLEWREVEATGDLPRCRSDFAAAVIPGKGGGWIIMGGQDKNQSEVLGDVYCFDFEESKWQRLTELKGPKPTPRMGHAAVTSVDQQVYLISGVGQDDEPVLCVERITPPQSEAAQHRDQASACDMTLAHLPDASLSMLLARWQQPCEEGRARDEMLLAAGAYQDQRLGRCWVEQEMPGLACPPRCWAAVVARGSEIYVFGGRDLGGQTEDPTDSLFYYNPASPGSGWEELETQGPRPFKGWGICGVEYNNRLYFFGGCNYKGSFNSLNVIDLTTHCWSCLPGTGDRPCERNGAAMVVWVDEEEGWDDQPAFAHFARSTKERPKILVFGGVAPTGQALNDLHQYDVVAGVWKKLQTTGAAPFGGDDVGATIIGRYMYVLGPSTGDPDTGLQISRLSLTSLNWCTQPGDDPPNYRPDAAIGVLCGQFVVHGGVDGAIPSAELDVYDIELCEWKPVVTPPFVGRNPMQRISHNLVAMPGTLHVIGGRSEEGAAATTTHLLLPPPCDDAVDRGERIETQLEEEKKKARMEARARNREQRAENMMQAAKLPSHFRKQIAGLGKASFE
ncbi:hypothetical protein CYMTET_43128 [Cymbomonas tetramitiformis]|uniref:Uncharacterized protein n=1 Tax=Cymbomonas tetramitiformis TaxID=36881 RepID=A0AAE0F0V4_9CHLO|nr:hypothetical protein CYMTET_43128 [Cymbomonas tetramitiformis]